MWSSPLHSSIPKCIKLTPQDRQTSAKKTKLYLRCFHPSHFICQYTVDKTCKEFEAKHYILLHISTTNIYKTSTNNTITTNESSVLTSA